MNETVEIKKHAGFYKETGKKATWSGVIFKTIILMIVCILGIGLEVKTHFIATLGLFGWIALMAIQLVVIFTIVKQFAKGDIPKALPIVAFILVFMQGMFVGSTITYLAAFLADAIGGIAKIVFPSLLAITAILTAILVLISILASKSVKYNASLVKVLFITIAGVFLLMIVGAILSLFGITFISQFVSLLYWGTGFVGIAWSLVVIFAATYFMTLFIKTCKEVINNGCNANVEWFIATRIVYLIVWIYVEVLRLLVKLVAR